MVGAIILFQNSGWTLWYTFLPLKPDNLFACFKLPFSYKFLRIPWEFLEKLIGFLARWSRTLRGGIVPSWKLWEEELCHPEKLRAQVAVWPYQTSACLQTRDGSDSPAVFCPSVRYLSNGHLVRFGKFMIFTLSQIYANHSLSFFFKRECRFILSLFSAAFALATKDELLDQCNELSFWGDS